MIPERRPSYNKVAAAKKAGDLETLRKLGKEGAARRQERELEKKIRTAEVDSIIDGLKSKMADLDALLRVYTLNEQVDLDGDVLPATETDPATVEEVRNMYLELKNQIQELEDKKAAF